MKHFYRNYPYPGFKNILHTLTICLLFSLKSFFASAQCPTNIDFELGDFTGWECYVGSTFAVGTTNVITWSPATPVNPATYPTRFQMMSAVPGNGNDPYGNFPMNCPNGSGHSIKLGNSSGGHEAEGVSYTFTIPLATNQFNLIYNYAVVLNDGGVGHDSTSQPRFVIEVKDLTDNTLITCSSFPFVVGSISGFFPVPGNPSILYKNWAAASINLDSYAGKTIQLLFKTADCTFTAHFGYAYLDVNTECSSAFTGATFCPDDTAVNVVAPSGYESYRWFNLINPNLGNTQTLTLKPPPLSGDSVFVELTPFNGYGCLSVLTAHLWDTLTVHSNAGPDRSTCDNDPVQLGVPPEPGRVYSWSPVTGLSNPNISNPIATPSVSTTYTLTVTSGGGGCSTPDVVDVHVDILSDSLELIGAASYCIGSGQSAALKVLPHDSIQWFKDNVPIPGAVGHQQQLNITQTGAYYAMLFSYSGCNRTTKVQQIDIYETPVAGFTTNAASQCDAGNQNKFIFTNTSVLTTGTLQYDWDLGDGTKASTPDVTHTYSAPGKYTVVLIVTAPGGCTDQRTMEVTVNPDPVTAFKVDESVQCFKDNWYVFTNQSTVISGVLTYTWDFGDGSFDNSNNIAHHYAIAGTYDVKLTARETNGGCTKDSTFKILVQQSPVTDFLIDNNIQCFPGNQFALTNTTNILSDTLLFTWDMGDGVIKTDKDLVYNYAKAGDYTIKLLASTLGGCKDSMTRNVIVHPTPTADFSVRPVCEDILVPVINRTYNNTTSTINYMWDFGNGHKDYVMTPRYAYPVPGTYALKLTVSTAQCPVSYDTKTVNVTIDAVTPGIVYPDKDAAFNYNEPLQARQIGTSVTWTPATSLSNRFSYTPVFRGLSPQLYTIAIKTATGCITVDTQLVKTHKKIEIYVPTAFTPDGNGTNDRLRPVLIGFIKVNYFRVYDRWGKLLFSMNSDLPGWDGKYNGQPVDIQTVVWMIEAVDVDGVVHNKQGTTVLYK